MADLLIRGMEMPQSNDEKIIIYHDGTAIKCDLSFGRRTLVAGRGEAVEVPDHGPLCDLDAFMEEINLSCLALGYAGVQITGDMLWAKLWDAYENADTIIPASKEGGA